MSQFLKDVAAFNKMNAKEKTDYLNSGFFYVDGKNVLFAGDFTSVLKIRVKRFSFVLVAWPQNKGFFKDYFADEEFQASFVKQVFDACDKKALGVDVFDVLLDSDVSDEDLMGDSEEDKFFLDFLCDFYINAVNEQLEVDVKLKSHLHLFVEELLLRANNYFIEKSKYLFENMNTLSDDEKKSLKEFFIKINVFIECVCISVIKEFKEGEVLPWNFSRDEYVSVAYANNACSCRNLSQRFIALALFFNYSKDEFQSLMNLFTIESLNKRFVNGRYGGIDIKVGLFNVLYYKFREGYEEGFAEILFSKFSELSIDESAITGLLTEKFTAKTPKVFINDCLDRFDNNLVKKIVKENKSNLGVYVYSLMLNDELDAVISNNSAEVANAEPSDYKL